MRKIFLSFVSLGVLMAVIFSCTKKNETKSSDTEPKESNYQTISDGSGMAHKAVIQSTEAIPMSDPGLNGCLSCYNSWISSWLNSLSPEALKMVFEDYPFLKGYVVTFNQTVEDYQISILTVVDENTNEDFSLIRKIKGDMQTGSFSGEYVLTEMNGTEILHNTYVNGVRTNEINNLDSWVENPTVLPCYAQGGAYFGKCTRSQFNAAYQRAKSECEGDWVCDFACSSNPCQVAYLASAMIDCW